MSSQHIDLEQPSAWVARFAKLIPSGEVLDLACGGGRHSRYLARLGYRVLAVDRDPAALGSAAGEGISTLQADLENPGAGQATWSWPFETDRFSGIVVTNYLHRPLFTHILSSLAPGGILIYETFAAGNERFGKPSNPAFLLTPGELLRLTRFDTKDALRIVAFEDGYIDHPKPAMVQRICAARTGPVGDAPLFPLN